MALSNPAAPSTKKLRPQPAGFLAFNSKSAMEIIARFPDEDRTPLALDQDRS
jgi:hypothetical protein